MRLFACDRCDNPVHFDNTVCLGCGHRLGYRPEAFAMTALEPAGEGRWTATADRSRRFLCTNAEVDACNWLLEPGAAPGLCPACRHNRTIPDLSVAAGLDAFRRIVLAERQLFYSLMRWRLPTPTRAEAGAAGLAFDFLDAEIGPDGTPVPVTTGHAPGPSHRRRRHVDLATGHQARRDRQGDRDRGDDGEADHPGHQFVGAVGERRRQDDDHADAEGDGLDHHVDERRDQEGERHLGVLQWE